jgi:hypothetical protein
MVRAHHSPEDCCSDFDESPLIFGKGGELSGHVDIRTEPDHNVKMSKISNV